MSVVIVIAVVTISNVCLSLFFTCMSAICNLKQTCMSKDLKNFFQSICKRFFSSRFGTFLESSLSFAKQ